MNKLLSNILIVVVIYKQKIIESNTIRSLIINNYLKDADILVYDNSPYVQEIPELKDVKVIYKHDKLNLGVSKAYNYACRLGEKMNKEWILIYDQDSFLPKNSLEAYLKALRELSQGIFIIAPKLYCKSKLLSPCKYAFHRGFHLKAIDGGLIKIKNISLLNSGLLLNINAIKQVGYFDENLFDYSDHDFICRFSKKHNKAYIMDLNIQHSLSTYKNKNYVETATRLNMLRNSTLYYSKKHRTLFPIIWLMLRSLKLSVLNKNFKYIAIALFGLF